MDVSDDPVETEDVEDVEDKDEDEDEDEDGENDEDDEDDEDDDEEEEDDGNRNEDELPAQIQKFGPPNKKKPIAPAKTLPRSSPDPSQPRSRRDGKGKTLKKENQKPKKNLSEKKRKAEDELDVNSPTKFQKRGPAGKPVRATTKTKGDGMKKVRFVIDDLKC